MKIKKILIIEDEKPNADRLKRLLNKIRPTSIILSVEDSIESSVEWLTSNEKPDLILMDVRLADGLSFEILNRIEVDSPIIFVTAYEEYAVKAFKYNSVDYLLKPVEEYELDNSLRKIEALADHAPQMNSTIENLIHYLQPKEYRKRFLLNHKDGFRAVLSDEIYYFYTELSINKVILNDGSSEVITQSLEELEQQLNPKIFFRANRQFILNIQSVDRVYNDFNGKLKIILKVDTDREIIVSREKAQAFKAWLDY